MLTHKNIVKACNLKSYLTN